VASNIKRLASSELVPAESRRWGGAGCFARQWPANGWGRRGRKNVGQDLRKFFDGRLCSGHLDKKLVGDAADVGEIGLER